MNYIDNFKTLETAMSSFLTVNEQELIPQKINLYIDLRAIEKFSTVDHMPLNALCSVRKIDDFSASLIVFNDDKTTLDKIKNAIYKSEAYISNNLSYTERNGVPVVFVAPITIERKKKIQNDLHKMKNAQIERLRFKRQEFKQKFIISKVKEHRQKDEKLLEQLFLKTKNSLEKMFEEAAKKI